MDLGWIPLDKRFEKRLKWVDLMAANKKVNYEIIDKTGCSAEILDGEHSRGLRKSLNIIISMRYVIYETYDQAMFLSNSKV